MKDKKSVFFCKECGYESPKWMGQCPACKEWNCFVQMKEGRNNDTGIDRVERIKKAVPAYISDISIEEGDRYSTGMSEFDRVLGGGIVAGSLILLGGDPGIGKSTLTLQACINIANSGNKVIYISGEESLKQIKLRAQRLNEIKGDLSFLCETSLEIISDVISDKKPEVVIIDSIQTMQKEDASSVAGSVSQIREVTQELLKISKILGASIIIIGHVTKDGQVAGPRMLEHMVDAVLYFEGDDRALYRILRGVKNRFGSTNEIGVFEMSKDGLSEVNNPSQIMLSQRPKNASGACICAIVEGSRPILIEIQALANKTSFGMPRRTVAGTYYNKTNLIIAVLEKYCKLPLGMFDIYMNVAGGVNTYEPAMDLAIAVAIYSSVKNKCIDEGTLIFGELGLSGEIRSVSFDLQRIKEAEKMGFNTCILPYTSASKLQSSTNMKLIGVRNIGEALEYL